MGPKIGISKFILPVLAVVLGVSAFLIISKGQKEKKPVEPSTQPSTSGNLGKRREGLVAGAGIVEPSSELVGIGATVPGVIKEVLVKTNDVVQKNVPLFLIDDREAAADVVSKSSGVAVAKSNMESAIVEEKEKSSSLALYQSIGDKRAMSEDELTRRRFAAQSAVAKLQAARALLTQSEALLSQAKTVQSLLIVRAPFQGTILHSFRKFFNGVHPRIDVT